MNTATYCPEDNKLRLYVGRVPREEYLKLRADGWVALHKQREAGQGDFAATWTPSRRDTALQYADMIEDEDAGPEERAADRAERFGDYRDKRTTEALLEIITIDNNLRHALLCVLANFGAPKFFYDEIKAAFVKRGLFDWFVDAE